MEVNGVEVRHIRPMTEYEKDKYLGKDNYFPYGNTLFCIELVDNSIIYPTFGCIQCMSKEKCLFNYIDHIP
jgi:hypothetical protein